MFGVYIFAAVVCISALVQAEVPAPGRGALEGYCITNKHCKTSECCVKFGKQTIITPDLREFVDGKCEKFGSRNSDCVMVNNEPNKIYDKSCPCKEGLTCVESNDLKEKIGTCDWD